jgi:hypothetical protein
VAIDDSDHTIFHPDIHTGACPVVAALVLSSTSPAGFSSKTLIQSKLGALPIPEPGEESSTTRWTDQWSGDVAYGTPREAPVRTAWLATLTKLIFVFVRWFLRVL